MMDDTKQGIVRVERLLSQPSTKTTIKMKAKLGVKHIKIRFNIVN